MTTHTPTAATGAVAAMPARAGSRSRASMTARIPLARLVRVELRKSFDTHSGRWLLASLGGAAILTTGAIIAWAPAE